MVRERSSEGGGGERSGEERGVVRERGRRGEW